MRRSRPNPYEWHELVPVPREEWPKGPIKHIRLLADANIHEGVALYLNGQGIRVETVKELGAHRHADENIYQLAKQRGRVILRSGTRVRSGSSRSSRKPNASGEVAVLRAGG